MARKQQEPVAEEPPAAAPKRDSFRKYLEEGSVLDSLVRVVVALYERQVFPEDAAEFIRKFVGSSQGVDVESLRNENAELQDEVKRLEHRVQELKTQFGISE
jgi:TolA-binding protein